MKLKYLGWGRYPNTGRPWRAWLLMNDVPELEAKAGSKLRDRGPGTEGRFVVRDLDGTERVVDEEDVFDCHDKIALLRWRPPREVETALVDGIASLTSELTKIVRRTESEGSGSEKLDLIRRVLNGKPKPETETPENRFLRLKFDGKYDNGDPYKDWELLVDVPEIPVTRVSDAKPMHAVKGDVLRGLLEDTREPFRLCRDSERIGDPEWWQVRHLFEGLETPQETKPGTEAHAPSQIEDPLQRKFRLVVRGGLKDDHVRYSRKNDGELGGRAYHVQEAIEGTALRTGDFLIHLWYAAKAKDFPYPKAIAGAHVELIPRNQFVHIHEQVASFVLVESSEDETDLKAIAALRTYSGHKAARKGKDENSKLMIIRSYRSQLGPPIESASTEGAIFELLTQVGCRMPATERSNP